MVWFFFWIPLATLIAWYMGIHLVYFEMFEMEGFRAVVADFFTFLTVVATLGGGLAIWAAYNYLRFKGKEKRKAQPQVEIDRMAGYFELQPVTIRKFRQEKTITVEYDATGHMTAVYRLENETADSNETGKKETG